MIIGREGIHHSTVLKLATRGSRLDSRAGLEKYPASPIETTRSWSDFKIVKMSNLCLKRTVPFYNKWTQREGEVLNMNWTPQEVLQRRDSLILDSGYDKRARSTINFNIVGAKEIRESGESETILH